MLESLIIPIAIAVVVWVLTDYFSPHPALTLIVKVIVFVFVLFKLLALMGVHAQPGNAYFDYTAELHRDCKWQGRDRSSFTEAPEKVKVEPLTKAEALKRGLFYRAIGWGKHFPPDEDGYFIAKSDEFIPKSWSVPSPDDNFYRGTYWVNSYWTGNSGDPKRGQPPNVWAILKADTKDGLPHTRCFWNPTVK